MWRRALPHRWLPQAARVEVPVKRERRLDTQLAHDSEAHMVDQRRTALIGSMCLSGRSMGGLVDPDSRHRWQERVHEGSRSLGTESPPRDCDRLDVDVVVRHELGLDEQCSKGRRGVPMPRVVLVEDREQRRGVDEDPQLQSGSSR